MTLFQRRVWLTFRMLQEQWKSVHVCDLTGVCVALISQTIYRIILNSQNLQTLNISGKTYSLSYGLMTRIMQDDIIEACDWVCFDRSSFDLTYRR